MYLFVCLFVCLFVYLFVYSISYFFSFIGSHAVLSGPAGGVVSTFIVYREITERLQMAVLTLLAR